MSTIDDLVGEVLTDASNAEGWAITRAKDAGEFVEKEAAAAEDAAKEVYSDLKGAVSTLPTVLVAVAIGLSAVAVIYLVATVRAFAPPRP